VEAPGLIADCADAFGSQAVVVAIDAKRGMRDGACSPMAAAATPA